MSLVALGNLKTKTRRYIIKLCLTKNNFMEWIIKEILLASIPGVFVIISFIKFNAWVNLKINIYNEKKLTNKLINHEKT